MLRFVLLMILSTGVAVSQTWMSKLFSNSSVLGNALASNPLNSDIMYSSPGNTIVYVSRDRGYSWLPLGNMIPSSGSNPNIIKSIAVNPLDTLQLLVGIESSGGVPDRIMRTTDGGVSWVLTWQGTFSYYGKPVEFKPVHPDTVYTMGDDTLWRSTNFGSTWDTMSVQRDPLKFDAWCDAQIRPDSANILYLGDAVTGIWKTYDYGVHWKKVYSVSFSGEIPSIAIDPFNPRVAYASRFSGGGGMLKTTDWGETWHTIPTPIGSNPSWWVTCSTVHPGFVYFGVYSVVPGGIFFSRDSGNSWENFIAGFNSTGKFNYGLMALDSLTVIASQMNGTYKLEYPHAIQLLTPNGGETFSPGTHHPINWTVSNLSYVKLQYSINNGSTWTTIRDSVPSSQTSYDWVVPSAPSTQCRVRVIDQLFTSTGDTSAGSFSIVLFALTAPNGGQHWNAGSYQNISWTAVDFPYVKLFYSIDSGTTWNYITRRPSMSGSYSWLVPEVSSARCKIRVSNNDDSTMYRQSASVFSIQTSVLFQGKLIVADGGLARDTLLFGAAAGATDGIDPSFGEIVLPAKPPQGTFDARWNIPGTAGIKVNQRDTLSSTHQQNIFTAEFQPGPSGYPFTLSWIPESLKAGTYILRDTLTHGTLLHIDMRRKSAVVISDTAMGAIEIVECVPVTITYSGNGGWTLISLPVETGERKTSVLFPFSASAAFAYNGGYVNSDSLNFGVGYWLKLEQAKLNGCPVLLDTIGVNQGWNMIGSISSSVPVPALVTIPDSILASNFFSYGNGYAIASSIDPGNGYWIKSKSAGKIILSASSNMPSANYLHAELQRELHSLKISDEEGASTTLFFGIASESIFPEMYELPPMPPQSALDARFTTGRMVQTHPNIIKTDAEYPFYLFSSSKKIFFSWGVENEGNFTYILVEKIGRKIIAARRLSGHGSLLIIQKSQANFSLRVSSSSGSAESPQGFSLGECYPNPFNPTTHFSYTLPSDAYVNIKIYSLLGEEVAALVSSVQHAGVHSVEWAGTGNNGGSLSSGMYFVRMSARPATTTEPEFSSVRKVIFMK